MTPEDLANLLKDTSREVSWWALAAARAMMSGGSCPLSEWVDEYGLRAGPGEP